MENTMSRTLNRAATFFVALLLVPPIASGIAAAANDGARVEAAKALFGRYVALGDGFDPAVADLYVDEARIIATRIYPDGRERLMEMPGSRYKAILHKIMPLAKLRDDRSAYTKVTYTVEGDRVRIDARRYSVLKKYGAPHSLLVGPGPAGAWRIYEERVHTRP
jgi:hypothetical protein